MVRRLVLARWCSLVVTLCLVGASVAVGAAPPAAASGTPDLTVTLSGSTKILVSGAAQYTITATNPSGSGSTGYNAGFRVVLPPGVSYVSGSSGAAGSPTVSNDQPTVGSTTLVWRNVSDISPGGSGSVTFSAQPATATYPVGSTVTVTGAAYVNSDPRVVPGFTLGVASSGTYTGSGTATATATVIAPLRITKTEPSPEHELPRGVHDHAVPYTLVVTNNSAFPTTSVTVTDYLPAELEFLFCGATDNTASSAVEYAGAPRLDAVANLTTNCPAPVSVTTVTNPTGLAPGVYTRVVWSVADLTAGGSTTIRYLAGVPLRRNTATFTTGTGSLGVLGQGANLNNNSGTSTAERAATEQSATNTATVSGTYTGPLASGSTNPVTDSTTQTVSIEDQALQKSVSPGQFAAGGIATYTLALQTSEYRESHGLVISDHIPDGLCPLSASTNFATDSAASQCAATGGTNPVLVVDGVTTAPASGTWFSSVTEQVDGSFDVVFKALPDLPANAVVSLVYSARMRASYTSGSGAPTAAGDSYLNVVSLTATSVALPGANPPDAQSSTSVIDASSASLSSAGPAIDKTVATRAGSADCATASYTDTTTTPDTRPAFHEGDRVCFRMSVTFPSDNYTRNPRVTDFLPDGMTYESGSAVTTGSTVAGISLDTTDAATGVLVWTMGSSSSGALFAAPGDVFTVVFSAIVAATAATSVPDVAGNLMKFRSENTAGVAISLRDSVDTLIAGVVPVSVRKGISTVNGTAVNAGNLANTDGSSVRIGDTVVFRITPSNDGTALTQTDIAVRALQVWDVLPAGLSCSDVSGISDSGACSAAGTVTGYPTNALVRWTLGSSDVIAAGTSRAPLTYTVTVPATAVAGSTITNTAKIRSFDELTNTGGTTTRFPASNVDTTVPVGNQDAAVASDPSNVVIPAASVAKSLVTSITETGNTSSQATIGELVTWTVLATLPHDTLIASAVLTDPLPTGTTLISATLDWSTDAGATYGAAPAGAAVATTATSATVTMPSSYSIDATNDIARLVIVGRVTTLASNTHGRTRTNTSTFTSTAGSLGSTPAVRTGSATVTVVEPAAAVAKSNNAVGPVLAAQVVTFTLTASNTTGRPPAHDVFVVDCLPDGLAFGSWGSPTAGSVGSPVAGTGSNGCASGFQRLEWSLGDIAGGASATVTYTATVDPAAGANAGFTNTATIVSSTIDGNDATVGLSTIDERTYSSSAASAVTVATAALSKTITSPASGRAPVGTVVAFTLVGTIPASVNLYDAAIIDTLPAGLDASTLSTTSVTCSPSCSVPGTALTPAASGATTLVGWSLGDITSDPGIRTVTIQATAVLADVGGNVSGTTVTNRAQLKWNITNGSSPTAANDTFTQQSNQPSASVTVQEPAPTIAKTVSDTTPEPGDTFGYTVTVTNGSGANVSPVNGLTVTDLVPTGVAVVTASISGSGTYDSATRVITWTGITITAGSSSVLTYNASLVASAGLTSSGKTNTATLGSYTSLPGSGRTYSGGATATATVTPALPFLTPVKTVVAGTTAYVGSSFSWRITVTNSGTGPAYSTDITDTLPANWSFDPGSALVSVNGGSSSVVAPTISGQTLTWSNIGTVAVGQTAVVTFTATPGAGATTTPGVGASSPHVNSAGVAAEDATGATASASGSYAASPSQASAFLGSADLVMTKSHSGTVIAGSTGTFSLLVTNNGPSTAVGPFAVTDSLPAGLTPTAAAGTGWSCSISGQTVTCARTSSSSTLASTLSFPAISVTATVASSIAEGTALVNSASVTGRTFDPDGSNNTGSDTVTVVRRADLAIDKALTSTVVAGSNVTWTLDVVNLGPSSSTGALVITDTLDSRLTFVSASGSGWSCSAVAQLVTCTHAADLAASASAGQITLRARLDTTASGSLANTAAVTGPTVDPVPGNNTDTVTTGSIAVQADVAIDKSHLGTLVAGSPFTYEITVANAVGPSTARGVQVTDVLPSGLTLSSSTSVTGSWSCTGSTTVVCVLSGSLAVGSTATVRITVDTASSIVGAVLNSATVSTTSIDPNSSNDTDNDSSGSTARSDLAVIKSAPASATAGQQLTYTLTVDNNGPSDTSGAITVTDVLASQLDFVSAAGTGWACSWTSGTRTLTCTSTGAITVSSPASTISVVTAVAADAGPATVTNSASVSGPDSDPNLLNNIDDAPVDVVDDAELTLTKTRTSSSPARAGSVVTFDISVSNAGPSDADDITVVDTLPAGMALVAISGAGFTCTTGSTPACTRATLAAGASATLTVSARINSGTLAGTLTNSATVTTATGGDSASDNTDTAGVAVVVVADLRLTKSHVAAAAQAGETATYVLQVDNAGPSDDPGPLVVVDQLPAGLTYVSSAGGWACLAVAGSPGQTVTCTLASGLIAGASAARLDLVVALDPTLPPGPVTNQAAVSGGATDADASNDADDDVLTITTVANLSITKSHTGPVAVGGTLTFTLHVENSGPSDATDVVVSDTLPTGLGYVAATGSGWTCAFDSGTRVVRCDLASIAAAGSSSIDLVVDVQPAAYPDVVNSATVSSSTPDPDSSDDADTDSVSVPPQVDLAVVKTADTVLQVGEQASYTLAVSNTGATDDPGPVVVSDSLPAGLEFVSATGTGWTCALDSLTAVVTCTAVGVFATGASSDIALTVLVLPAAYPSVTNVAAVTSDADDSDPTNNSDPETSPVDPLVDLSVLKSVDEAATTGDSVRWNVVVTNDGPNTTIVPVVLSDTLPSGFTLVSATGTGWTCAAVSQTVTCTYPGFLGLGDTASLVIDATVSATVVGSVTNTASILDGEEGPVDTDDNSSTADWERPVAGLAIAGSALCVGAAPYVDVTITGRGLPSDGPFTLTWTDADGRVVRVDTVPSTSSRLLWPGTGLTAGTVTDWPGWRRTSGGSWVADDDGLTPTLTLTLTIASATMLEPGRAAALGGGGSAWLAAATGTTLAAALVPASASVVLTYPPDSAACAGPAPSDSSGLAPSGGSGRGVLLGLLLVVVGGVLVLASRQRT